LFDALLDSKRMGKIKAHGIRKKGINVFASYGIPSRHTMNLICTFSPKNGQTMFPFATTPISGKRTRRNLFFHFKQKTH